MELPSYAKILSRQERSLSPWVRLVEKELVFAPGQPRQTYHCLAQDDCLVIVASTPGGLIPIVRQYRAAAEAYTWELPAGLLEQGESPAQACVRELEEETGLKAESVTHVGAYFVDTVRLENRQHVFYVQASEPDPGFVSEPGMSVKYVSLEALKELIRLNEFPLQPHIAAVLQFESRTAVGGQASVPEGRHRAGVPASSSEDYTSRPQPNAK